MFSLVALVAGILLLAVLIVVNSTSTTLAFSSLKIWRLSPPSSGLHFSSGILTEADESRNDSRRYSLDHLISSSAAFSFNNIPTNLIQQWNETAVKLLLPKENLLPRTRPQARPAAATTWSQSSLAPPSQAEQADRESMAVDANIRDISETVGVEVESSGHDAGGGVISAMPNASVSGKRPTLDATSYVRMEDWVPPTCNSRNQKYYYGHLYTFAHWISGIGVTNVSNEEQPLHSRSWTTNTRKSRDNIQGNHYLHFSRLENSNNISCKLLLPPGQYAVPCAPQESLECEAPHLFSTMSEDGILTLTDQCESSVERFFLTVSFESVLYVAKHACENNKIFCMNLSAPFIIQFFGKQLDEIMPYVDILFSNDDEAKEYGKNKKIPSTPLSNANSYDSLSSEDAGSFRVDSKNYVHDVVSYLVNLPKVNKKRGRIVVITQGPHPTVVGTLEAGVSDYICPKIPVWSIVDTNGAGDAFVGGFISQLALGETISECVAAGQYAASVIIRHSGCTFPPKPDSPPYATH